MTLRLTEPLRRLERLAALIERALARDAHALAEIHEQVALLFGPDWCRAMSQCEGIEERLLEREGTGEADCNYLGAEPAAPVRQHESEVLDEAKLVALAVALASLERGKAERVRPALEMLVTLAAAADVFGEISRALARGGVEALPAAVRRLVALGFPVSPPPMQTMSGQMPGGLPPLPSPGPGLPGRPPGKTPGLPGDLRGPSPLDEFLGWIRGKKRFDPEIWDHRPFWWRDPVLYLPPGWIRLLRCLLAARKLLNERAAIPPPLRPSPVVWADGITGVNASGMCPGARVDVVGTHFNAIKNRAVLLVPFADGCHPLPYPVIDWSNKKISFALPPGVVSGVIGFGDKAYVEAYDQWVTEQNRIADEIRSLWCGALVGEIQIYKPFGECPPDIIVNRLRAGAPIIDAFTINGGSFAVVNPGGTAMLAWTVRNADQIRIERVSGAGPLLNGATSVTDPPGTTLLLGAAFFGAPSVYTYRLTATGPCGNATSTVTLVGSKAPGLWISSVEVTQSIQTIPASMRLVQNKPTVARVTVNHGLWGFGTNSVPNVTGRLRVRRSNGSYSPWWSAANNCSPMAANPTASITVVASPQRNNTADTLNFLIPPGWATGTIWIEVEVRTSGYGAAGPFVGYSEVAKMTAGAFSFAARRTLELRYIRVNWGGTTPTDATCQNTLLGAVPLLPTPAANVWALAGVGVQNPGGTTDDDRDDLLDEFDDRHNCSVWEALTEWLGSDCPDDDGAIWVIIPGVFHRGRAYDIPSNTCFTPPNNGPYAAHELSHCFDQEHVSVMCANGQTATGGDSPGDWPNNAQLVDVPFDVVRNKALTLAGTGVFDVMTYCGTPDNTWPMPARWDRLWNEIGT